VTDASIVIVENGPYLVRGPMPLAIATIEPNEGGGSWTWRHGRAFDTPANYALCRCGASKNKPFCDGSHQREHFDGAETASRTPFAAGVTTIDGPVYRLEDAVPLCAFARFCDNAGGIWSVVATAEDGVAVETVVHEAASCPSGRLVLRDVRTNDAVEPELERSIAVVEDPAKNCSGPLWLRGGIPVVSTDGTSYDVRNRQTLCRCGRSANKPFCDGTHADIDFRDGLSSAI
jgi:CDGSH-type Zn-finger protein